MILEKHLYIFFEKRIFGKLLSVRVKLLLIIVSTEVLESILKIIIYYRRSSFEKKCISIVKKRKFCKNCSYYYCIYENCLKKFILNIYKKIAWKIYILVWPPWRNRLARSAVNRKVGGSSPPGGDVFSIKNQNLVLLELKIWVVLCINFIYSTLPDNCMSKSKIKSHII
uniref:Uncharacterized protein n=1 Tax=Strongyloides venezuelensis TaxID=75913 RepID=A0A0K0FMW3_STRVS